MVDLIILLIFFFSLMPIIKFKNLYIKILINKLIIIKIKCLETLFLYFNSKRKLSHKQ